MLTSPPLLVGLYALFLLAITYQCLLYGYLSFRLFRYSSPPVSPTVEEDQEGVSIIISAHNERRNLEVLLPLLLHQQYTPFEIVVADDLSTDGTSEFLTSLASSEPQLCIVPIRDRPTDIQPKKYALTQAIRAARFDKLLLTDADCQPKSQHWLSQMTRHLQGTTQFALGYSPYHSQPGLLNRFIRYETLHTGFLYIAAAVAGHPYMGVGRNLAYRKLFFIDQGGFKEHQTVVGGDDDLWINRHANKHNTAVVVNRFSLVYSNPKTSWTDYFYQKKRHLHVGQYYQSNDKIWLGLLSLSTIAVWVTGIPLWFLFNEWVGIVTLFLVRWLILAVAFSTARRQLHDPINLALLPILDLLHVMYYIVVGTIAFCTKNIRWTN